MGITHFGSVAPGYGTATEAANVATINHQTGSVLTSNLATANQGLYTCTLTNNRISTTSQILVTITAGSYTTGTPVLQSADITASTATIKVRNIGPTLNGTFNINFWVLNPTAP